MFLSYLPPYAWIMLKHLPTILTVSLMLACSACSSAPSTSNTPSPSPGIIRVSMQTSRGTILLDLDRAHAPISVGNFLAHAAEGDYDNTCFHRVVPGFVIQGGGWTGELIERAKAAEAAGHKDQRIKNEWTNGLKNTRGTIGMARDTDPDTATREFYINLADNARLDTARETTGRAGYAVFGRVVEGMDVVDEIARGKTIDRPDILSDGEGLKNVPVEPVMVLSVKPIMSAR